MPGWFGRCRRETVKFGGISRRNTRGVWMKLADGRAGQSRLPFTMITESQSRLPIGEAFTPSMVRSAEARLACLPAWLGCSSCSTASSGRVVTFPARRPSLSSSLVSVRKSLPFPMGICWGSRPVCNIRHPCVARERQPEVWPTIWRVLIHGMDGCPGMAPTTARAQISQ